MNAPLPNILDSTTMRTDLSGAKILLDARNLDMPQGTGIKTYGLTLVSALQQLKAEVSILHGRDFYTKDQISDVLFFDYYGSKRKTRFRRLRHVGPVLRAAFGQTTDAVRIAPESESMVIRPPAEQTLTGIQRYNARNCYKTSELLFDLFRKPQRIKCPARFDVWHSTYVLPLDVVGPKKITTIHDCIPFRLPWTTLDKKQTLYDLFRHEIAHSDLIFAVSESSKQDTVKLFDVDPEKIEVTYEPVHLTPLGAEELKGMDSVLAQSFGLQPQGYILYVGAIEPKKNLPRLVEAYLKSGIELPLVVAGKKAWLWRQELGQCRTLGAFKENKVRLLNYVSYEHLRYLYAGAQFFAFPSLYEGFGLPPLEAMVSGTPVLTSNSSSLPEVCGDAALYVDPESVPDIQRGLMRLASDASLRNQLQQSGIDRAKQMSVENYLQRLLRAYGRIL